jgi:RND family efflux transporter MFP subunit
MTRSTKLGRRLAWVARSPGAPRCVLRAPLRGAIVVAVLAAFGLLGSVTLVRPRADEPAARDQAKGRRVRVERVKRGEVRRTTAQPGTVQAFESAEIFAKISGYLTEQKVDIGDRVKKGELLAVIDARELLKAVEQANAAAQQAIDAIMQAQTRLRTAESEAKAAGAAVEQLEAEADRAAAGRRMRELELANTRKLHTTKVVSQIEVDLKEEQFNSARAAEQAARAAVAKAKVDISSADSRVDQARADLVHAKDGVQLARAALDRARVMADAARIFSPYDGVVTLRSYHPGDFIRAADAGAHQPLFRVARTDKMRVVTQVPDRDVPYLERGNPATVVFDALPDQTFRGAVARFAEAEDPQTRTMRTEIDLDNSGRKLREGMYGVVTIVLGDPQSGLTIPRSALFIKGGFGGSASCFRIVDGRSVLTPIQLGQNDGTRALVLDGLKEGDLVVIDPAADGVKEGEPVEIDER